MQNSEPEIEVMFSSASESGQEFEFGCDASGKLYVNGKAVVTTEKIVLQGWMNAAIVITAVATLAQALCAILALRDSRTVEKASAAPIPAVSAPADGVTPWHDKLMQIMVRHPGGDWQPREVRSLEHSSAEAGNVKQAFVSVDFVSPDSRDIRLFCGPRLLADAIVTPSFAGELSATCYGVDERITLVSPATARFPTPPGYPHEK